MQLRAETREESFLQFEWKRLTATKHLAQTAASLDPRLTVRTVAVGSAQITAPDGLTVARAIATLDDAGYPARASESHTGSAARAAAGTACCGGAATSVAPKGRGCCG